MRKLFTLISMVIAGCSGPSDPVITKALEVIEGAYVLELKPADASFAKCKYLEFESRHVAQCGFSFGSTQLEQIGFWELVNDNGKPAAFAMNGNALRALEKFDSHKEFKSGAGQRPPLDIAKIKTLN